MLDSLTASRQRDQTDLKLMIGALSEELTEFPPDVVRTALRKWAKSSKWWPTLAEIREECLWRVERRRELLKSLK